jgi:2-isopropylmalate synthase
MAFYVVGGNGETPRAVVRLKMNGSEREFDGEGDGMVHAAFAAIRKAFKTDASLVDYRVVPVTAGADAMAEVSAVVRVGDSAYSGRSVSTDVVEGSAEAFIAAFDKVAPRG